MQKLLNEVLRNAQEGLEAVSWESPDIYGNFLAQTYYFVCHSTRLLASAASRLPVSRDALFKRFVAHLGEEKNHEVIALTDLRNLGSHIHEYPEMPETRAFYEAQYYKVEHQGPVALMGYILFLEAIAVRSGPGLYQRVTTAHGEKATRFLKVHIEEDENHVGQAIKAIQQGTPEEVRWIEQNLVQSGTVYRLMLDGLSKGKTQRGTRFQNEKKAS